MTKFTSSLLAAAALASVVSCNADAIQDAYNEMMDDLVPDRWTDASDSKMWAGGYMAAKVQSRLDRRAAGLSPIHRESISGGTLVCENGMAGDSEFECSKVDIQSFVSLADLGCGNSLVAADDEASDIWGWTDPDTKDEYAIIGCISGTSFVRVTDPENPVPVGFVRGADPEPLIWRDIKVYNNHAFIVADLGAVLHGVQVFDMKRLRGVNSLTTFATDADYDQRFAAHNIGMNEETGYAIVLGSFQTCAGGLHFLDVRNPKRPLFAGCFATDGYTHDAQCVIYRGPDERYRFQEICFAYNEDTITTVDVTDKIIPTQLSSVSYEGVSYTHQGWLTDDHRYVLMNDEGDETDGNTPGGVARTYIFDYADLENPVFIGVQDGTVPSIDHNLYTLGRLVFQSHYGSGVRISDMAKIGEGTIEEIAWVDLSPEGNAAEFFGVWSNYPYFPSGNIAASVTERGLFMIRPHDEIYALNKKEKKGGKKPAQCAGNRTKTIEDEEDNTVERSNEFNSASTASAETTTTTTTDSTTTIVLGAAAAVAGVSIAAAGAAVYQARKYKKQADDMRAHEASLAPYQA